MTVAVGGIGRSGKARTGNLGRDGRYVLLVRLIQEFLCCCAGKVMLVWLAGCWQSSDLETAESGTAPKHVNGAQVARS